jgi:hypothetical protein
MLFEGGEVEGRLNVPFEPRSWVNGFDGKAIFGGIVMA